MTGTMPASAESLVLAIPPMLRRDESPLLGPDTRAMADAAAAAGFGGISICTGHPAWGVGDEAAVQAFLDRPGRPIPVITSEVINVDLQGAVDPRVAADENGRTLDLAALAGARSVNVITLAAELPPLAEAAPRLGALCDLAADRGLAINLEFLPWTGLPDITAAMRLIEATDRDNLGIVLDVWHWFRRTGGPLDASVIRSIPPERIHVLQLNDLPAQPTAEPLVETISARLLPGEGVVDIAGLLAVLDEIGASPVVALEIFSSVLEALPPEENARRQFAAARAVLDDYRASLPLQIRTDV